MKSYCFRVLLLMFVFGCGLVNCAFAADFPKKDIKIIVPFDAGGGTDIMARIFSSAAAKNYLNGRSLVVENMGGGGGGQTFVAKTAAPDGYTVILFTSSAINNTFLKKITYSYQDFKPIIGCNPDAEILAVPANSPYNTLDKFLAHAKEAPVKVSTPGHSSGHHIRAMNMARLMGLNFRYIHNGSAALQLAQLMGGHCDVSFMTVAEATRTISDGQAVGLAIMAEKRSPSLPDVPTFKELGYDGWIDGANRGFACHKDVPDDIYNMLVEEFTKIAKSGKYMQAMKQGGMEADLQTPKEYQQYIDFTAKALEALTPELLNKK